MVYRVYLTLMSPKNPRILLANGSQRCQGGETGGPSLGPWALVELGHEPIHVDGRGNGHVLQMRFR
jgi:hypothetical protein